MEKKGIRKSSEKLCPYCGASNPATGYACLTCYKVMKKNYKVPFWKIQINHTVSVLFLIVVGLVGGLWFIRKWSEAIEAEMSIRIKMAEYQISVVAGKVRDSKDKTKESAEEPESPGLIE